MVPDCQEVDLYQNMTTFPYTELNSNGLRKLTNNDPY